MGAIIGFIIFIFILVSIVDAFKELANMEPVVFVVVVLVMAIPVFFYIGLKRLIGPLKQSRKFQKAARKLIEEPLIVDLSHEETLTTPAAHQWQIACLKDLQTIREAINGALSSEVGEVAENWMALLGECHERIRQLGTGCIKASLQEKISTMVKETEEAFYPQVTLNVARRHLANAKKLKWKEAKLECLTNAQDALTEGIEEQTTASKEIQRLLKEVKKQQKTLAASTV
jgi:hypothetical protein